MTLTRGPPSASSKSKFSRLMSRCPMPSSCNQPTAYSAWAISGRITASRSRPTPAKPKVQANKSPFVAKDDTTYMLLASSKTPWRVHTKGNRKSFSHLSIAMSTQGCSEASRCFSPKSCGPRPIQSFGIFFTAQSCFRFFAPSPPATCLLMRSTCPKFLFASCNCFTKVKPPDFHGCTCATTSFMASSRAPTVSSACSTATLGSNASQGRQTAPPASRAPTLAPFRLRFRDVALVNALIMRCFTRSVRPRLRCVS
mmetsp:Transcript_30930/g.103089  ORF Transcript_30930/g.103089 Transcript_30930/m.103089 type:complete len:255 (+) Transcript_30930:813-1577(+)